MIGQLYSHTSSMSCILYIRFTVELVLLVMLQTVTTSIQEKPVSKLSLPTISHHLVVCLVWRAPGGRVERRGFCPCVCMF
ncbi:hypothetical protein GE21DRAFT_1051305 [Neurospora crassa]|nr:hypothetical protein GE21DRAFT_1051305 [Neurospora crassa]